MADRVIYELLFSLTASPEICQAGGTSTKTSTRGADTTLYINYTHTKPRQCTNHTTKITANPFYDSVKRALKIWPFPESSCTAASWNEARLRFFLIQKIVSSNYHWDYIQEQKKVTVKKLGLVVLTHKIQEVEKWIQILVVQNILFFSSEWQVYKYCNSIVEMMKGDDGLESSAIRSKPLMG